MRCGDNLIDSRMPLRKLCKRLINDPIKANPGDGRLRIRKRRECVDQIPHRGKFDEKDLHSESYLATVLPAIVAPRGANCAGPEFRPA